MECWNAGLVRVRGSGMRQLRIRKSKDRARPSPSTFDLGHSTFAIPLCPSGAILQVTFDIRHLGYVASGGVGLGIRHSLFESS